MPYNQIYCNFILNVAPNREGSIDENALVALKEIGSLYKKPANAPKLMPVDAPIISSNLAKRCPATASWSNDMAIMDFATDDNFGSSWFSNPNVKNPWFEVNLRKEVPFNMIVLSREHSSPSTYSLEYFVNNKWYPLTQVQDDSKIKVHRFDRVWAEKVRVKFLNYKDTPSIAELGVFNERR